ncbi:MAG TPA: ABC transporter permease [Deltaproteobacteria bacterium]|nr:ABC transporter permease [Deltaproteobacteria bacterium]
MKQSLHVARKEISTFFSSATAFIFLGAFLSITFFIFFWVETFFSRNIADVRPLFEWMPILVIFLSAAITMRMWSEERRSGTLEFLLASPAPPFHLVMGKFLACLCLVLVALALTLPLPVTVSFIGSLDWGPVAGGYLATLFLAAAYISIGLFVSARSENQIVSLMITTLIGGILYIIGSDALTGLFGGRISEMLKLVGSGSRFESITRGIIDIRDLYFYLCVMGIFLTLNIFELERRRWAGNETNRRHRQWGLLAALLIANFLAANLWLAPVGQARVDITSGTIYSISDATRSYLARLHEPLLIRGYFSARTHPLLAPLVPRLHDLLKEYALAGSGRVRVEFIDPVDEPDLEQEAGQKYGIRPVPFQVASKYQSSVVNSYFDILVKYGDQFETLGFQDLIEVKVRSESDLSVDLRNPEYDITRAIKKVLYAYQGAGDLFSTISHPVTFTGYISADNKLPKQLAELKMNLQDVLEEVGKGSGGQLIVEIKDPDADGGDLAQKIQSEYGFRPMASGIFSRDTFWFYMVLEGGNRLVQVPLPEDLGRENVKRSIEAGLKRFSTGFLKTVALHTPPPPDYGRPVSGPGFSWLRNALGEEHRVESVDLKNGWVPEETDLLMILAPERLDTKQLFAMDQFLMRGGTVVLAMSPFSVNLQDRLSAAKKDSGLAEWLDHHGINVEKKLVLDPQNAAFPIPVERRVAGFSVRETRMVEYPYFVDIRADGMDRQSGIAAGIDQVTLNWASPIAVDPDKNKDRNILRLLQSSPQAWTSEETNLQPDFSAHGALGFPTGDDAGRKLLALVVEGRFSSYFTDRPFSLIDDREEKEDVNRKKAATKDENEGETPVIERLIDRSTESARIVLFASDSFVSDTMMHLASGGMGTQYINPVNLVKNVVDWSLEDRDLLGIRGRTHFSRTLIPLDRTAQVFWEYLNYSLAGLGLFVVWLIRRWTILRTRQRYNLILSEGVRS